MIAIKKNPKKNNLKKKQQKKKQVEIFELYWIYSDFDKDTIKDIYESQNFNINKTKEILESFKTPVPIKSELELLQTKFEEIGKDLVLDIYESLQKNLIETEKVLENMLMEKKTEEFEQNMNKIEQQKAQQTNQLLLNSKYDSDMTEAQFVELNNKINQQLDLINGQCYQEIDKQFQMGQNTTQMWASDFKFQNTQTNTTTNQKQYCESLKEKFGTKNQQDFIPTQTSKEDSYEENSSPHEMYQEEQDYQIEPGVNKKDFLLLQQHLMKELKENKEQEDYLNEHFPTLNENQSKKKQKNFYTHQNSPIKNDYQKKDWNVHFDGNFETYDLENAEIANLCSQFPKIDQKRIETFYINLGKNFQKTQNFMISQFPNQYQKQIKKPRKLIRPKTVIESSDDEQDYEDLSENASDMQIYKKSNQDLQIMYSDLRNARKLLLNNIKMFQQNSTGNNCYRYDSEKNKARNQIELYSNRSIYVLYVLCAKSNFKSVDLHFLTVDESIKLLEMIFTKIKRKFQKGFKLEIITGKGNHSKNRKAILFPSISNYLKSRGYKFTSQDQSRLYCVVN